MVVSAEHIDLKQWNDLLHQSSTASWFQSPQAYQFYQSVADELEPFCLGQIVNGHLKAVCVGYIVGNFFSARAIIQGGLLLADDIENNALEEFLNTIVNSLKNKAIYIELRNLNDYSSYKSVFQQCGFDYRQHLNYVQSTSTIKQDIDRNRRRNILKSELNGLQIEYEKSKISLTDKYEFYDILLSLYRKELKLPLFSRSFFLKLIDLSDAHFFITRYNGTIVGGELCVGLDGRTLYDWYGCGDNTLRSVHPSEYITFKAIVWANTNGFSHFDFMGAGTPEQPYGVRDFKARFGGQLVEYGRFIYVCSPLRYQVGRIGVKMLRLFGK